MFPLWGTTPVLKVVEQLLVCWARLVLASARVLWGREVHARSRRLSRRSVQGNTQKLLSAYPLAFAESQRA